MSGHQRGRRARGVLAVCCGIALAVLGLLLGVAFAQSQPAAPAILGGGGTLAGVVLLRVGLRQMRSPAMT